MKSITSIKDPLILSARQLNKPSERLNRFLLEGERIIQWALESNIAIEHVFVSVDYCNEALLNQLIALSIPLYQCSDGIMKKINDAKYLTPIIAVAKKSDELSVFSRGNILLFLEDLQDQGNLGTIIRTACALGVNDIATTGQSSDLYNKKTMTASRGTVFKIHQQSFSDSISAITHLKSSGYQIVATSPHGKQLQSFIRLEDKPVVLLVGNETNGVSSEALALSDQIVQIPMYSEVESLNVGVATGISLYELKLKVLIAMLTKNIRSTLGRDLGVAHQLVRQVFDQEIRKIGNYNSQQVILMMIMVCDQTMNRSQIEKDMAVFGEKLDALLEPLLNQRLIHQNEEGQYWVTPEGESFLGKIWHAVEVSERKILKDFSDEEIEKLRDFILRIQRNCEAETQVN